MFDVHTFIECIHNENPTQETSSKEYMDQNIKAQSWANVGQIVYKDWADLSSTEKDGKSNIKFFTIF